MSTTCSSTVRISDRHERFQLKIHLKQISFEYSALVFLQSQINRRPLRRRVFRNINGYTSTVYCIATWVAYVRIVIQLNQLYLFTGITLQASKKTMATETELKSYICPRSIRWMT